MQDNHPRVKPTGVAVNVAATLGKVQLALRRAKQENNPQLRDAADSVLSALVLVLKKRHAVLPEALRQHLTKIEEK